MASNLCRCRVAPQAARREVLAIPTSHHVRRGQGVSQSPRGDQVAKIWPKRPIARRLAAFRDLFRHHLSAGSTDLNAEAQLQVDRVLLPTLPKFIDNNQSQAARLL